MFIYARLFVLGKPFQAGAYPTEAPFKCPTLGPVSCPYPQTLDSAVKAFQGQTL